MKAKLSLTLDQSLVAFVDSEPGESRSEKIEAMLRRYREARRDASLRLELAAFNASSEDDAESAAWRQIMETAQWSESAAATSGPSRSPRSRNRARR
jgi:metal-responsive CopG/Arc/MetJ family transcriptional regulator